MSTNLIFKVGIVDELAGAGVDGREQEEDHVEQDERLDFGNGHACLDVKLRQGPLAGDDLADDGERNAELRQPPHEQLVGLGEPEHRTCRAHTHLGMRSTTRLRNLNIKESCHKPYLYMWRRRVDTYIQH